MRIYLNLTPYSPSFPILFSVFPVKIPEQPEPFSPPLKIPSKNKDLSFNPFDFFDNLF